MPTAADIAKKDDDKKVDYAGLMAQPIDLQFGHNYKASKDVDMQCSWKVNSDIEMHNNVSYKINKNLTAKVHQHFFSNRVGTEKAPMDVGFEFNYKL